MAAVAEDVGVLAAGVFEGVGQDAEAREVQAAIRQRPLVVDRLGQVRDGPIAPE